jgi:hypothetical protein
VVPGSKPVRLLVKTPAPEPSVVLKLAVVGFWVIAQHTPRAVTAEPPSAVILPPLVAVVEVMAVRSVVVKTGASASVVNVDWLL